MKPPNRHAGGLSRRAVLKGSLAATAGLAASSLLGACGTPLAAGLVGAPLDPQTVTFWNLFGGGDGARLATMLEQYQKQNGPDSLESATFAWGDPYYTKVTLATVGGKAPDVAISHLTRMQNLAEAGLLTPITDEMLGSVGLSADDFSPVPWKNQKRDGKNYAIPLDTHPFVLFYNIDVCRKAGLIGNDGKLVPIKGVKQWEAALEAAKKATGEYAVAVSNIADYATPWRLFQSLYTQMDGATPFLSDGGRSIGANTDLEQKTLAYIQRMRSQGWLNPASDYGGAQTLMFSGKAAFYLEGEWEITTAQSIPDLKFGMAPIPQLFDKPSAQADSHTFVLPSKDRSPEQTKRHMGFIASMLKQSMTWAKGGHIPAYLPTFDSTAYRQLEPQADYAGVADYAVYDSPAWYSGSGSVFENTVGAQIALVQQGLATPAVAASAIRSQLQPYLDAASPL